MKLIDRIKIALRVTSAAYDPEVEGLIAAARDDLTLSGIDPGAAHAVNPDPLIERAIALYCKWHFGMDNPDAEGYERAYRALESHLALSSDYKATV